MKNKRNVWNHAMIINLNIIIYVMMIVQMVHIEYFKTEIYARLKFQTIIDNNDNIYKECYNNCKKCSKLGNETINNCDECINN